MSTEEETLSTQTEEAPVSEESTTGANSIDTEETEEEESKITSEDIENMSDDEFTEFLANEGKISSKKEEPEQSVEEEEKEEKTPVSQEKNDKEEVSEEVEEATPDKAKVISKPEEKDIDYKSAYESIFKPFKANGKEIEPRNVDDVISLMQMGANYTKKMQEMAPMKKAITSLRKAKIDNEDKLNFIIDLYKGDQEAVKKLLKDNKVDLMDLDLDTTNYKPGHNLATDEEIQFDDVLQDVSSSLPKINDIMNNVWDSKSKSLLLRDPALLKALHEEIQYGRFDEVQKQVDMEKTFGRYKGVPDIQIYTDIVNRMANAKQQEVKEQVITPKHPTEPSQRVSSKAKAAPTRTKHGSSKCTLTKADLFAMSEEDFNKISMQDLI